MVALVISCVPKKEEQQKTVRFWVVDLERNHTSQLKVDTVVAIQGLIDLNNNHKIRKQLIDSLIQHGVVSQRYNSFDFFISWDAVYEVAYKSKRYPIYAFFYSKLFSHIFYSPRFGVVMIQGHGENYQYLSKVLVDNELIDVDEIIRLLFERIEISRKIRIDSSISVLPDNTP